MTTTGTTDTPRRREDDFAVLFPELYRSAFTAAHAELGSRATAHEVTHATLARAHARWSRIGDSPAFWVSTAARTHALDVLQRQPPGREVLVDDEAELGPGEIPAPDADDLATVTRRGTWLRLRRRAGWAAAGACVIAAVALMMGVGDSLPPSVLDRTSRSAPATAPDHSPIGAAPWQDSGLTFGRISAGRSVQGSVRLTFEPAAYERDGESVTATGTGLPQQLAIDPEASLVVLGAEVTPERLVQVLNRSVPGGQTEAWVRIGKDNRITALREA